MEKRPISLDSPQKHRLIDHLHFAFAGIVTCIYLAAEIVGFIASPIWHPELTDWLLFGVTTASVLFSGFWSFRQIRRGEQIAWVFLIGDGLFTLVSGAVFALFISMQH